MSYGNCKVIVAQNIVLVRLNRWNLQCKEGTLPRNYKWNLLQKTWRGSIWWCLMTPSSSKSSYVSLAASFSVSPNYVIWSNFIKRIQVSDTVSSNFSSVAAWLGINLWNTDVILKIAFFHSNHFFFRLLALTSLAAILTGQGALHG